MRIKPTTLLIPAAFAAGVLTVPTAFVTCVVALMKVEAEPNSTWSDRNVRASSYAMTRIMMRIGQDKYAHGRHTRMKADYKLYKLEYLHKK